MMSRPNQNWRDCVVVEETGRRVNVAHITMRYRVRRAQGAGRDQRQKSRHRPRNASHDGDKENMRTQTRKILVMLIVLSSSAKLTASRLDKREMKKR